MISVNDLRTGLTIELDGEIYSVVEFLHVKPGKGAAFVRTKLKNIKTGAVAERTFRAGEKVESAHIETSEMQFLYQNGDEYVFMDTQNYEQIEITTEVLGDVAKFLKENMEVLVQIYEGAPIGVILPTAVELKVIRTEPGFKGDTATGGNKPAELETGLIVQVPLFIEEGEILKVDTRTGEYISRA
ncbi:MAG: elongation factor P [Limnochordia bacterium]|nr:elongation factor P [Limnochordia bacterium]MDD2629503.1 elongation factor P [Limnochordia bacterium]MDD4518194.1 elongation factor P [Limnochordia bacterium]